MPSSRHDKAAAKRRRRAGEAQDFAQLGLDFTAAGGYSEVSRKEPRTMDKELFAALEKKIDDLLNKYSDLKADNARLAEENQRLQSEREGFKSRVDSILGKLEGF
jgi:cell division protein ZapB